MQAPPSSACCCCLCRRPADTAALGGLGALLAMSGNGVTTQDLLYHEACAGYSSAIAWGRVVGRGREARREPYRHGEIPALKLAAECVRGRDLVCSECGGPGATLGCIGINYCGCSWHLPCARAAAQHGGSVVFSGGVVQCACAQHASRISDPIQEPAGDWFEAVGGWDNHLPDVEAAWGAAQQRGERQRQQAQQAQQQPAHLPLPLGQQAEPVVQDHEEVVLQQRVAAPPEPGQFKEVDGVIYLTDEEDVEAEVATAKRQKGPPAAAAAAKAPAAAKAAAAAAKAPAAAGLAAHPAGQALEVRRASAAPAAHLADQQSSGQQQSAASSQQQQRQKPQQRSRQVAWRGVEAADSGMPDQKPPDQKRVQGERPPPRTKLVAHKSVGLNGGGRGQQPPQQQREAQTVAAAAAGAGAAAGAAAASTGSLPEESDLEEFQQPPRQPPGTLRQPAAVTVARPAAAVARAAGAAAAAAYTAVAGQGGAAETAAVAAAEAAVAAVQEVQEVQEDEEEAVQREMAEVSRHWRLPGHQWVKGGDILGPPPHAEGALVVLNTVIPYPTAYQRVTQEYMARMRASPGDYPPVVLVANAALQERDRKQVCKNIAAFIRKGMPKKAALTPQQLLRVLEVADCGERFKIEKDDPRVGLAADAGPMGWRNRKRYPVGKHTVLGCYQSLMLLDYSYQEMITDTQLAADMGLTLSQLELYCDAYAADASIGSSGVYDYPQSLEPLFQGFRRLDSHCTLTYHALGFGNPTALINDIALDPLAELRVGKPVTNMEAQANCMFVEALVLGWPFLFVVTTARVPPQAEFLLEYGVGYWKNVLEKTRRNQGSEAEHAALRATLEEQQRHLMQVQAQQQAQQQTSTQQPSGGPNTEARLAGLETQASAIAAGGDVGSGGSGSKGGAAAPAAASAHVEQEKEEEIAAAAAATAATGAAVTGAAAAATAAAAAAEDGSDPFAPQHSMQGSPTQPLPGGQPPLLDMVEGCATSPGPKPGKIPQLPLPAKRPAASTPVKQQQQQASGSKRGSESKQGSGRKRSRSRSPRRSGSRRRSRSRSRHRQPRSRSPRRSRSRERRRSRSPPRHGRDGHAARAGSGRAGESGREHGGSRREGRREERRDGGGQRGRTSSDSRSRSKGRTQAIGRERGEQARTAPASVSALPARPASAPSLPTRPRTQQVQPARPGTQQLQPAAPAHGSSVHTTTRFPTAASHANAPNWQQQHLHTAMPLPPAHLALPAGGGRASPSPSQQAQPLPEESGGTPDLAEVAAAEAAAQLGASPQRSSTPDLLDPAGWEGQQQQPQPQTQQQQPVLAGMPSMPPGFRIHSLMQQQPSPGLPPGFQLAPPQQEQPYQQSYQHPQQGQQAQQPEVPLTERGRARERAQPAVRERSETPDLMPLDEEPDEPQQQQQQQQQARSPTPDLLPPPPQQGQQQQGQAEQQRGQRERSATPDLMPLEEEEDRAGQQAQQAQQRERERSVTPDLDAEEEAGAPGGDELECGRSVTPDLDLVQASSPDADVAAGTAGTAGTAGRQHPAAPAPSWLPPGLAARQELPRWLQPTGVAWAAPLPLQQPGGPPLALPSHGGGFAAPRAGGAPAGRPPAAHQRHGTSSGSGPAAPLWPAPGGQAQQAVPPSVAAGPPQLWQRQVPAQQAQQAQQGQRAHSASARAALPEPQPVGRVGSLRERHAATVRGLSRRDAK